MLLVLRPIPRVLSLHPSPGNVSVPLLFSVFAPPSSRSPRLLRSTFCLLSVLRPLPGVLSLPPTSENLSVPFIRSAFPLVISGRLRRATLGRVPSTSLPVPGLVLQTLRTSPSPGNRSASSVYWVRPRRSVFARFCPFSASVGVSPSSFATQARCGTQHPRPTTERTTSWPSTTICSTSTAKLFRSLAIAHMAA